MPVKKKRNTPKVYPNPGTGEGKNPRPRCPKCGRSMYKSQSKIMTDDGKREAINPNYFCKCGYVQVLKDEIKKIPD